MLRITNSTGAGENATIVRGSLRGAESTGFEKRQVFDLPKKITIEVTEHRAETGICPCCSKKVKASFPEEVTAPVQYGERIQTLVIYLHTYQLLPCERLGEFFGDVFGCSLCPGTVCSMPQSMGCSRRAHLRSDQVNYYPSRIPTLR
ncbi:MAG: hypothetical protein R3F19_08915 [Verrucomicrobiales bacterium]